MRWSYKTVRYELKKEGLLGSAFLDESEMELSINEYGKAGWELVSILEIQEGLIAVFKQPLSVDRQTAYLSEEETNRHHLPQRAKRDDFTMAPDSSKSGKQVGRVESPVAPVDEYEIVVDEQDQKEKKNQPAKDDIGSIRIE